MCIHSGYTSVSDSGADIHSWKPTFPTDDWLPPCPEHFVPRPLDRPKLAQSPTVLDWNPDGMSTLGMYVSRTGSPTVSINLRIAAANRRWFARASLYTSKARTLRLRVDDFYSDVVGALLWGASLWSLCADSVRRLERFERASWRSISSLPPLEGEPVHAAMSRTHERWRVHLRAWGIPTVLQRCACLHVQMAFRMADLDGHSTSLAHVSKFSSRLSEDTVRILAPNIKRPTRGRPILWEGFFGTGTGH